MSPAPIASGFRLESMAPNRTTSLELVFEWLLHPNPVDAIRKVVVIRASRLRVMAESPWEFGRRGCSISFYGADISMCALQEKMSLEAHQTAIEGR